jgi:hypothetical protein
MRVHVQAHIQERGGVVQEHRTRVLYKIGLKTYIHYSGPHGILVS